MAKAKGSNPLVKKILDKVGEAVLGPKDGRGTTPPDPRELDDKSNGGAK